MKNRKSVYDWPLRIFHWLFALLFVSAFFIAKNIDDESAVFSYHMLAGILISVLVVNRIIWGFFGTRYSRFSSFQWNPKTLFSYFFGVLKNSSKKWPGHNPATSWVSVFMMAAALGLGISGYLMTSGNLKEELEDIHELLADGFLVLVVAHLIGLVVHSVRFRDWITLSMITGKKSDVSEGEQIENGRGFSGVAFLFVFLGFAFFLFQNFDSNSRKLNMFGNTISLGEAENGAGEQESEDEGDSD